MMAQLRKYRVGLVLANQYLGQLDIEVRDAVLGNAGTLVMFRIGAEDASFLEKEVEPRLTAVDLIRAPNNYIYLKLMIDGHPSTCSVVSADTLA